MQIPASSKPIDILLTESALLINLNNLWHFNQPVWCELSFPSSSDPTNVSRMLHRAHVMIGSQQQAGLVEDRNGKCQRTSQAGRASTVDGNICFFHLALSGSKMTPEMSVSALTSAGPKSSQLATSRRQIKSKCQAILPSTRQYCQLPGYTAKCQATVFSLSVPNWFNTSICFTSYRKVELERLYWDWMRMMALHNLTESE